MIDLVQFKFKLTIAALLLFTESAIEDVTSDVIGITGTWLTERN